MATSFLQWRSNHRNIEHHVEAAISSPTTEIQYAPLCTSGIDPLSQKAYGTSRISSRPEEIATHLTQSASGAGQKRESPSEVGPKSMSLLQGHGAAWADCRCTDRETAAPDLAGHSCQGTIECLTKGAGTPIDPMRGVRHHGQHHSIKLS